MLHSQQMSVSSFLKVFNNVVDAIMVVSVNGHDIVVHVHVIDMRVCELTVHVTCFYGHELVCTCERIHVACGHQYHTQDHHDKHASKDVVASRAR